MPAIPTTQEAEAGESLEPRRWRLQQATITSLHSNLGNKSETPSQKKIENNQQLRKSIGEHKRVPLGIHCALHFVSVRFVKVNGT